MLYVHIIYNIIISNNIILYILYIYYIYIYIKYILYLYFIYIFVYIYMYVYIYIYIYILRYITENCFLALVIALRAGTVSSFVCFLCLFIGVFLWVYLNLLLLQDYHKSRCDSNAYVIPSIVKNIWSTSEWCFKATILFKLKLSQASTRSFKHCLEPV